MDLKSTLNLPDADFTIPMKAGLPTLEPEIMAKWRKMGVYEAIQANRKDAPPFVLHDGPPYTNGPIHLGTALNKILKDFVFKSRTLMGYRTPNVPGYDNHGLPIEQAVLRKFQSEGRHPDVVELRKACREHAAHFIGVQTEQFERLGVLGMWDRPYATMDFRFEAEIIRVFKRLVGSGYVYRGLRPVMWSPSCQTALADTEIVYQEHTSRSIYVRFALTQDPNGVLGGLDNLFTVIWTTTPWTIPGNLAVAFHPKLTYAVVRVDDAHYLLLEDLLESVAAKVGWSHTSVVRRLQGSSLEHTVFAHPVYGRDSLGVLADYVTTEDGTGVVHTAPGHGREDFMTGQKYGLPVLCPVDAKGVLTAEAGEFAGISYKKCDEVVVQRLREVGALLFDEPYVHSYPHAERDNKPVIFRATDQWFVDIDHHQLRERMLEAIDRVDWVPSTGKARITAMVANRPDWCISRQRPWGVGIPVFYGAESGEPVLDPVAIEAVAKLVECEGSDAWYSRSAAEILPQGYRHPGTGESEFVKETDVFDVWFDSGCTSMCVLEGNVEPRWKESWPADMYLEGSDQHRGWFNVSLVLGMAVKGDAPYRQVVTHGFVVDEKGMKMSKRLGNDVDPVAASAKYGADIVRLWAASVDFTNDVPCSDQLLRSAGETYRSIRNTLRFLLANLADYDPDAQPEMDYLDRWVIDQTNLLVNRCLAHYKRCEFTSVLNGVHNFCVNELSRFYLDAIKDRMYCDGADWTRRRSAQAACQQVLVQLVKLLSPILAFTAEEVYARIPGLKHLPSVHMELLDPPEVGAMDVGLESLISAMLEERAFVFSEFERWKAESGIKDSQDVVARFSTPQADLLREFGEDLALFFKMSEVELEEGERLVEFRVSEYLKCERCRLRRKDVEPVDWNGQLVPLSARDRRVLGL